MAETAGEVILRALLLFITKEMTAVSVLLLVKVRVSFLLLCHLKIIMTTNDQLLSVFSLGPVAFVSLQIIACLEEM